MHAHLVPLSLHESFAKVGKDGKTLGIHIGLLYLAWKMTHVNCLFGFGFWGGEMCVFVCLF